VFDWNRTGLDGKARALHITESLASIDFEDFEPQLKSSADLLVADCEYFHVEKISLSTSWDLRPQSAFALAVSLDHPVTCGGRTFAPAEFFLIPASGSGMDVSPTTAETHLLVCTLPTKS
jgi:mannose-6-phosphate isomerase